MKRLPVLIHTQFCVSSASNIKMYRRVFALLTFFLSVTFALENEPLCLSRYDYDYKIMQKIVSMEQEQKNMKQHLDKQETVIRNQEQEIEQMRAENEGNHKKINQKILETTMVIGSVYIRWGRTVCPGNGSETVYAGYAGGSWFNDSGAAANYLCLPQDPLWGMYDDNMNGKAYVHGAEYEIPDVVSKSLFKKSLKNGDVPCALCRSSRSSAVMIPARNDCYGGWTVEYTGYLMAGNIGHKAASEYTCMDGVPEMLTGGRGDNDGRLFYSVEAYCSALRCPPYVHGREITCVVCTI